MLLQIAGLRVLSLRLRWQGEHSLLEMVVVGELVVAARTERGKKDLSIKCLARNQTYNP